MQSARADSRIDFWFALPHNRSPLQVAASIRYYRGDGAIVGFQVVAKIAVEILAEDRHAVF